jgi:hypothetical protein
MRNTARKLEFEPDVWAQIAQPSTGRRPARRRPWRVVIFLLVVAIAGAAGWFGLRWNAHRPAAEACRTLVEALREENYPAALALTPEDPTMARRLAAMEARIFRTDATPDDALPAMDAEVRRAALEAVREDAAAEGLDWPEAEAVAFSGVRAEVFNPRLMTEPAPAYVGNIYLRDGSGLYALEVSLRPVPGACAVTGVWQAKRLPAGREPEAHAEEAFRAFEAQLQADGDGLNAAEDVYLPLQGWLSG